MLVTLRVLSGSFWPDKLTSHEFLWLASSGLIGLTIGDSYSFLAFNRIDRVARFLFMTLVPPVTALLAWPLLGEPVTLKMAAGIILTIAGVALVIDARLTEAERGSERAATCLQRVRRSAKRSVVLAPSLVVSMPRLSWVSFASQWVRRDSWS